jgi:RTX calcium-binding nonapeptide repeat (4 copies)/Endonuclease/Exonuclease/phosphatase family
VRLTLSPGRIDSSNTAWSTPEPTRRSLVGEFMYGGTRIFAIANHLKSKSGDDPLWGRFQPPVQHTQAQRIQQAQVVNDFVDSLLAIDPQAKVLVMGDINDFWFSSTLTTLEGGVLTDLVTLLPDEERYSYVFEGNSQDLDHILVSNPLAQFVDEVNMVHINAEFHDQISDHDPVHTLIGVPAPQACAPGATNEPDLITGTEGPDHLCGLGGADVIDGNGGNDLIDGGAGDDRLSGEGGDDRLFGRKGADQISGGSEDDALEGGAGGDTLDTVDGVGGNDVADGGAGPDACTGDAGDAEISCEA